MPTESETTANAEDRPGLLIVDHGTRNERANARFADFAARVGLERPGWLVEHAHMELAEPSFVAGLDRLVQSGAQSVFIHLHFLGAGYHVRETIPELVAEARARYPDLPIEISAPLGEDPRLVEIIVDRLDDQRPALARTTPRSPLSS